MVDANNYEAGFDPGKEGGDESYKTDFIDREKGVELGAMSPGRGGDAKQVGLFSVEKLEAGELRANEVMCPDCGYIADIDGDATRAWLEGNRPDLFRMLAPVGRGGHDPMACRCEELQRENASLEQRANALAADREKTRIREANLPRPIVGVGQLTYENFKERKDPHDEAEVQIMMAGIKAWEAGEGPHMATVVSVPGAGKSHLAQAAVKSMIEKGMRVRYEKAEIMLNVMRKSFSGRSERDIEEVMEWIYDFDAFVIDDLGANRATDWGTGYMTLIVDHFYENGKRLLITTNVPTPETLADAWDARIADRVFDENSGRVNVIMCAASSYRTAVKA